MIRDAMLDGELAVRAAAAPHADGDVDEIPPRARWYCVSVTCVRETNSDRLCLRYGQAARASATTQSGYCIVRRCFDSSTPPTFYAYFCIQT